MAVKKKVAEEVVETVEVEVANTEEEKEVETTVEADVSAEVEVDVKATEKSVRKEGNVKIRMREDHRCTIAMVRYDLKKGQSYNVPENVKRILEEHGLLAPLN